MKKISTREILPSLLYENADLDEVYLDENIKAEWEELKAIKRELDTEVLLAPSDTSVAIIMAYALGKEEAAPTA
jgi:hypothetical protein